MHDPLFLPFVNGVRDPPVRPSREYVHTCIQNYLIGLICVDLFLQGKLMQLLKLKLTEDLKSNGTGPIQDIRCRQKYYH